MTNGMATAIIFAAISCCALIGGNNQIGGIFATLTVVMIILTVISHAITK